MKLKQYEKEAVKQKAELEIWKYQADILDEVKKSDKKNMKYVKNALLKDIEVLSHIESDVDMSDNESIYTGGGESDYTVSSGVSSVNDLKLSTISTNSKATTVTLDPIKREANKRQFYAEAVNFKLNLPPNHAGRDILISDLYEDCCKAGVKLEDWGTFIRSRFQLKM